LEGDSCTKYFHAIANGRRRKCSIPQLITPHGEVDDQRDLMEHVYDFYRGLMGATGEDRVFSLASDLYLRGKNLGCGKPGLGAHLHTRGIR
jgi:hypothetical protein